MFGCCNSLSTDISLRDVLGIPSSSHSKRIFFKATSSRVIKFRALYTMPYVPKSVEIIQKLKLNKLLVAGQSTFNLMPTNLRQFFQSFRSLSW